MKIIKYQLMREVNHGTEDEPNIVQTFSPCEIQCSDSNFDANYALALKEAYNSEVTVEEVEDENTEPTQEERIAATEESVAALEDALCEADAANAERFAAIEDALCEMDMG